MPRYGTYATRLGLLELDDPRRAERDYLYRRGRRGGVGASDDEDYGLFTGDMDAVSQGRAQRASLAGLSEALAPDEARRLGISEDEARAQMEGGVAYPEGPLHYLARNTIGRLTGGFDEPTGEAADVRIARLQGRGVANESEEKRRAMIAKTLFDLADQLEDPNAAIAGQATETLRSMGIDVGPDGIKFREHVPESEIEALARPEGDPYRDAVERRYALQWAAGEHPSRAQPPKLSLEEQLAQAYEAKGVPRVKAIQKALRDVERNKAKGTLRGPNRQQAQNEQIAFFEDQLRRAHPRWDAMTIRQEAMRRVMLYGSTAGVTSGLAPEPEPEAEDMGAAVPPTAASGDPLVDEWLAKQGAGQ